jgi:hypothetical protein
MYQTIWLYYILQNVSVHNVISYHRLVNDPIQLHKKIYTKSRGLLMV